MADKFKPCLLYFDLSVSYVLPDFSDCPDTGILAVIELVEGRRYQCLTPEVVIVLGTLDSPSYLLDRDDWRWELGTTESGTPMVKCGQLSDNPKSWPRICFPSIAAAQSLCDTFTIVSQKLTQESTLAQEAKYQAIRWVEEEGRKHYTMKWIRSVAEDGTATVEILTTAEWEEDMKAAGIDISTLSPDEYEPPPIEPDVDLVDWVQKAFPDRKVFVTDAEMEALARKIEATQVTTFSDNEDETCMRANSRVDIE